MQPHVWAFRLWLIGMALGLVWFGVTQVDVLRDGRRHALWRLMGAVLLLALCVLGVLDLAAVAWVLRLW